MGYASSQILGSLLRDVSRSFYLTLRVLPSAIRPQISLAYLLARTTDTIADTELMPLDRRLDALHQLADRIAGSTTTDALGFEDLTRHQGSPAERALLEKCETSLSLLRDLPRTDQELVIRVLQTIISGQQLDLRRFAGGSPINIIALRTPDELDDYAYRVAGCVGEFWTRMCCLHLFSSFRLDQDFLQVNGVRFGKGLQLVNILRDLSVDLRAGRCYLPEEELRSRGLQLTDLLESSNESRLRPVYDGWLDQAESHLAAGWAYTNHLPRRSVRIRLACAWPLLLGDRTLLLLRRGRILDPTQRIKVSRAELRRILWRSVLYYPWQSRWESLHPQVCERH
jgi:farnesyl-diphosphate farnesyltransferase